MATTRLVISSSQRLGLGRFARVCGLASTSTATVAAIRSNNNRSASSLIASSSSSSSSASSTFISYKQTESLFEFKRAIHGATRVALAGGSSGSNKLNPDGTIPFLLTDIGEGIKECEIIKWFVKVGDRVEEFQQLAEVQSDKANVVISSRYTGVITKIYVPEGEMIKVMSPLVDIRLEAEEGSEAASEEASTPAASTPSTSSSAPTSSVEERTTDHNIIRTKQGDLKVLATPATRRLARELNVNLNDIVGSGKDGRVTKEDILNYSSGKTTPKPAQTQAPTSSYAPPPATRSIETQQQQTAPAVEKQSPPAPYVGGERRETVRGLRRSMIKTMGATTAVPHFGYCDEIVLDSLTKLREELKPIAVQRGIKLTYLPFMLKAISLALKSYPILNSSLSPDLSEIIYKESHNLGIAMDTPQGLIVPNIKNCQLLSIFEIAEELNRLQKLGAEGKLSTSDLTGGTFTLSNIGAIGGTYASPVLVLPEVVIGAIGKVQVVPRFAPGSTSQIIPVRVMPVSWSGDHRIIDGATIANFSNLWKRYLENPTAMLIDMK